MTGCDGLTESPCNLDQWMTSAGAAILFACENWDAFCAYVSGVTGHAVPIARSDLRHHGWHLTGLVDPERLSS